MDKVRWIRRWNDACSAQWRAAWESGTSITIDETMVFWTGIGDPHLTYLPRKPSPLGIMYKVVCDANRGALLHIEPVEGAEVDQRGGGQGEL